MTTTPTQLDETLPARIAKLEQLLEELLNDSPAMDDEINAAERDLQALRRKLAESH